MCRTILALMARFLWHVQWLEWNVETQWDMYSDFVVCCATEAEARDTCPGGHEWKYRGGWIERAETAKLKVTPLGVAYSETPTGLVCVSFHAG